MRQVHAAATAPRITRSRPFDRFGAGAGAVRAGTGRFGAAAAGCTKTQAMVPACVHLAAPTGKTMSFGLSWPDWARRLSWSRVNGPSFVLPLATCQDSAIRHRAFRCEALLSLVRVGDARVFPLARIIHPRHRRCVITVLDCRAAGWALYCAARFVGKVLDSPRARRRIGT